ncbi:MAG: hypothetical protein WA726_13420 [Acidimicrobiia bacterium]
MLPSADLVIDEGTASEAPIVEEVMKGHITTGAKLRHRARTATLIAIVLLMAACGDAPLGSLGRRSSHWIDAPTVVTTTTVPTTVPIVITADSLMWYNDTIGGEFLDDPEALKNLIFGRRGGDLYVQSSRAEIVALVPDLEFPSTAPYLSEYVTSQIVFDNDGELATDPIAAFGIWSSEPYTRSRSVAQLVILRISKDAVAADEVTQPGTDLSCARFSDRSTETCATSEVDGRPLWILTASNGTTFIFFRSPYRYELFARSFISTTVLEEMASDLVPLSDLGGNGG